MIERFKKACEERGVEATPELFSLYCAGYNAALNEFLKKHYGVDEKSSLFEQKRKRDMDSYKGN